MKRMLKDHAALLTTALPLPNRRQGKVRDVYDCMTTAGDPGILIIATDRISAFDVVMPNGIPGKGVVLTQLSNFWFERIRQHFGEGLKLHVLSYDASEVAGITDEQRQEIAGRTMVGRRASVVPIECVARGYLAGSGWKEYQETGTVCGVSLPAGLKQCDKLPEPIFTPATKAAEGHDENISFDRACEIAGSETMRRLRDMTLSIYTMAHDFAAERGLILADTKFEFGFALDESVDTIMLIDEVLTPDSSRYWPADEYEPGRDQASFDKQYVRNYLQELTGTEQWNKQPPGPELPQAVVGNTFDRYLEAYERLTGEQLAS